MTVRAVLLATIMLSTSGPALAQAWWPQPAYVAPLKTPREMTDRQFAERMEALRQEALAQQKSDGGILTPERKAELQAKLDRIHAVYWRTIRRNDPMSVNSDGSSRY